MKNFIPLLSLSLVLLLSSCSKQSSSPNQNLESEPNLSFADHSLVLSNLDQTDVESVSFRLGSRSGDFSRARIYLKNQTGSSVDLADPASQLADTNLGFNSSFSIVRNRCQSSLGAGRTCYFDIDVSVDNGAVDISSVKYFPLLNRVDENADPFVLISVDVDESYSLETASTDLINKSESVINFGKILEGETKVKRLYFSNTSELLSLATPTIVGGILPNQISLKSTNCDTEIKPLGVCYWDLEFTYLGSLSGITNYSEAITFNSSALADSELSFLATELVQEDSSVSALVSTEVTYPANTISGKDYVRRVYISNSGENRKEIPSGEFLSGATVLSNSCLGVSLRSGEYCYIDFSTSVSVDDDPIEAITLNIPSENFVVELVEEVFDFQFNGQTLADKLPVNAVNPTDFDGNFQLTENSYVLTSTLQNQSNFEFNSIRGVRLASAGCGIEQFAYTSSGSGPFPHTHAITLNGSPVLDQEDCETFAKFLYQTDNVSYDSSTEIFYVQAPFVPHTASNYDIYYATINQVDYIAATDDILNFLPQINLSNSDFTPDTSLFQLITEGIYPIGSGLRFSLNATSDGNSSIRGIFHTGSECWLSRWTPAGGQSTSSLRNALGTTAFTEAECRSVAGDVLQSSNIEAVATNISGYTSYKIAL